MTENRLLIYVPMTKSEFPKPIGIPPAKKRVPFFHLKNSSCIRLLCTDQYLLVKRTFVVVAG